MVTTNYQSDKLARSARITVEVIEGAAVLDRGHEAARRLWNLVRYCCNLHGRQYRQRFTWLSLGRLSWPGRYGLDKAFRDHPLGEELADRCYSTTVKDFDIAYRAFMSNRHAGRKARRPRYCERGRPLYFELGRNAKHLGGWTFRLTVLGGHLPERHAIVKVRIRPGVKVRDIKAIRLQPDRTGTVIFYRQPKPAPGDRVAAVDLGIVNLAVVAFDTGESILYSGRGLLAADQWQQKRAAKCKSSGWTGKGHARNKASKRLIAYRVKAGNIRNLAAHNLTRSIIGQCIERKVGKLVVGDLKGIRQDKDFGKVGNVKLHAWPFAEIRRQLEYKAQEAGIEIIAISERNTSKTCGVCGVIDRASRVHRGLYNCRHCGAVINADLNGAFNILRKYLLAQGLGVGAVLSGPPSLAEAAPGTGEASQIEPLLIAKFDLRTWAVAVQDGCNMGSSTSGGNHKRW